jgi:hypothetical protein
VSKSAATFFFFLSAYSYRRALARQAAEGVFSDVEVVQVQVDHSDDVSRDSDGDGDGVGVGGVGSEDGYPGDGGGVDAGGDANADDGEHDSDPRSAESGEGTQPLSGDGVRLALADDSDASDSGAAHVDALHQHGQHEPLPLDSPAADSSPSVTDGLMGPSSGHSPLAAIAVSSRSPIGRRRPHASAAVSDFSSAPLHRSIARAPSESATSVSDSLGTRTTASPAPLALLPGVVGDISGSGGVDSEEFDSAALSPSASDTQRLMPVISDDSSAGVVGPPVTRRSGKLRLGRAKR